MDGTVFSSRYEVESKIGSGGMGAVYKATDNVLRKTVAVKVLLPNAQAEAMIRFHREAKMAAKLSHINILSVYDFGQSEKGELYLVMDFLEGESLADLLNRVKRLDDLLEALNIFRQISAGLAHAHEQGILHRDIKPSNIMLTKDARGKYIVKIVDFGLAKVEGAEQSLTTTGVRVGSPLYMSPEQCRGETVDHRSDLYSFGCLMYRALTGDVPFHGESYIQTLSKHASEEAPSINSLNSELKFPVDLAYIVGKLLEKDPDNRFQTATALQEALDGIDTTELKKRTQRIGEAEEPAEDTIYSAAPKTVKTRIMQLPGYVKAAGVLSAVVLLSFTAHRTWKFIQERDTMRDVDVQKRPTLTTELVTGRVEFIPGFDKRMWVKATPEFNDADMVKLLPLKRHKLLSFSSTKIALKDVSVLKKLGVEELDISHTKVDDRALKKLAGIKTLKRLRVDADDITDQGVKYLAALPLLNTLHLRDTKITDQGLETIAGFSNIEALDISGCKDISDVGLEKLSALPELKKLFAQRSPNLTARALKHLKDNSRAGLKIVTAPDSEETIQAGKDYALADGWATWHGYADRPRQVKKRESKRDPYQMITRYEKRMRNPEFEAFFMDRKNWQRKDFESIKNPQIVEALKDPDLQEFFKDKAKSDIWLNPKTWEETRVVQDTVDGLLFDN
jgi:serine/threonine protein kinase